MAKGPTKQMWKRMMCIVIAMSVLMFGAATVSLANIMIVDSEFYQQKAIDQQLSDLELPAQRGNIYDTNMEVLATSTTVWTVFISPRNIDTDEKKELTISGLTDILGVDRDTVAEKCESNYGYERIKQQVEYEDAEKLRTYIKENNLSSIIGLNESSKRNYPNDHLASTVLGFVGTDNQGLAGLEAYYEEELQGTPGRQLAAETAKGTDMPFSYENMERSIPGNSLVLTIDKYIQHIAEKYLEQAIVDYDVTNRGTVMVMNVNTGEILGMATKPDFDPNDPFTIYDTTALEEIEQLTGEERQTRVLEEQQKQWRNKAISDMYEPGSVFKIITGSTGLDVGATSLETHYFCNGTTNVAGTNYHCSNSKQHGEQDLAHAFMNSCNVAFIGIGQTIGVSNFQKYFKAYGLNETTGIDLPGEASNEGLTYADREMGPVELASNSFGQTFNVSPIQLITAVCAAVNGGNLLQPHMVKQILDSDGNIVENIGTTVKRQVISEETSILMRSLLEGTVTEGSGKNAYVAGYRVAGKTGTSEKVTLNNMNPDKPKEYIVSFCGVAPADNPEVAVLLLLDQPHGSLVYGSTMAAPSVGKIMSEILPYLGVQAQYTQDELASLDLKTPGVTGKLIQVAKNEINAEGLSVRIVGDGDSVIKQVPAENQSIPRDGTVVLYTEEDMTGNMAEVPDVTGLSPAAANEKITNAGLNIKLVGQSLDSAGMRAYSQDVAAGSQVEFGAVITVGFREETHLE